ncbi:hypothetical protein Sjap_021750 [Stephania japonica]|uniref:Uncharacterized protein n=1 Tax=Stephania japonica TaxID=461633 RepID=A0AAP0HP97_9MAGN
MRVHLNELFVGMTKLLWIHKIPVPDCLRIPIVCEETEGDSFFGGEGEFEDKEEQVNFDAMPKFDVGDEDSIEDRVVFGDDGHVIEVISQSASPRILKTMVYDGVVDNYLIEKGVETNVKFAATRHFCSLADDMDEELAVDALQESHDGVFVDNDQDIFPQILILSNSVELVKISYEDKFAQNYKSREDPIFFEEDFDNFGEEPKFDIDGYDFIEDKLVFGKDGLVIEVVSLLEVPQVREEVVHNVSIHNDSLGLIAKAKVLKFATNDGVCVDGYLPKFSS